MRGVRDFLGFICVLIRVVVVSLVVHESVLSINFMYGNQH